MEMEQECECTQTQPKICGEIDTLGLPRIPEIPQIVLCLHFPGTEGWNNHWAEFNKRVKEFHQSMIDFNWRIMEWYFLKSKQLQRFGKKSTYIAGNLHTSPRITVIYTKTISECDVMSEIRKCLPNPVEEDIKQLERTGYKLFLTGKIFIFNDDRVVAIDYDQECDKSCYRNCLRFSLYHKNEKINIGESYNRVYGDLRFSFLVGGIGGLLISYLTGYFNQPPIFARRCCPEKNLLWYLVARFVTSATCYTIIERILLLKFSSPQKYLLSGSTGVICGAFLGFCDNCAPDKVLYSSTEFGIFSLLCNLFARKKNCKINRVGSSSSNKSKSEASMQ